MLPRSASSPAPQFLAGRQQELLELQRLLNALHAGRGGLAIISGEAGIGKTTMVSRLTGLATSDDVQIFIGNCYDLETTPPYGPWLNSGILESPETASQTTMSQTHAAPDTTPERRQILEYLQAHGPSRPSDVAASLGMSANAATQSLRRLLADNLVVRPAYGMYEAVSYIESTPSSNGPERASLPSASLANAIYGQEANAERGTRQTLFRELWDLIISRSQNRPLIVVLEDMHWADQASVEFLRFVTRELSNEAVLIIVTYRDNELTPDQPLYRYLPHLVREGNAVRMGLRRLDRSDIRELLTQRYRLPKADETRLLKYIQHYTDGNPFFIHEVLLTMEQDLQLTHRDDTWRLADLSEVHVPPLVQQVIDARLERLSKSDHHLLQIASVIGVEVSISLLQEVAGSSEDEMLETIERAIDAHLLESVPGRPLIRFRHALVREAFYSSIIALRAQRLHQRVADALLQQRSVEPDTVAHHLRQASDERATEWLIRAGERAARQFAWIGAVERFRAAIDLMPDSADTALYRAWLHFHIGMLSRRSNSSISLDSLRTAAEISERENGRLLHGLSVTSMGLIQCIFGEIRAGLIEIERGVQILESLEPGYADWLFESLTREKPLFVRLPLPDPRSQRGVLIHWLAVAGRYAEAIEMGTDFVKRIPHEVRGTELIHGDDFYDAYLGLGHAYSMRAMPAEAAAALDAVRAGYRSAADLPLHFLQYTLMHLVYFNLDQPAERDRVERLVTSVWESHRGMSFIEIAERFRPPRLLFWYGEWDEVDRISRDWASGHSSTATRLVGLGLGMIARHRGNRDEAWSWTLAALKPRPGDSFGDCWCDLATQAIRLAADLALDSGDLEQAQRWIQTHAEFLEKSGARLGEAQHHVLEARLQELSGDIESALEHARQSLDCASSPRQPLDMQMAHRAVGRLLVRHGSFFEAEEQLAASNDLATRCSARFEIALTCHAQAELMIGNGKHAAARHKIAEAEAIATELGAQPLLDALSELSDSLADLSGKSSRPGGLTPRELDVLQLVARGLTDAEIAERLFVSPRTINGHLQSIYNKLGISSRAAATAFAYEQNLV